MSVVAAPAPRWCGRRSSARSTSSRSRIVDIGGGTGGFAVRLAELGHRVTVVDPSPDALAALDRRAREIGVAEVTGLQGDLSDLLDLVDRSADVVLCHGVLEVVDDPAAALATIARGAPSRRHPLACWSPSGTPPSSPAPWPATSHRRSRSWPTHPSPVRPRPAGPDTGSPRDEVTALLEQAGFEVTSTHGIRVFADLVPGSLLDLEPGATAALVELERAVAERPEYLPLATQLHLFAR